MYTLLVDPSIFYTIQNESETRPDLTFCHKIVTRIQKLTEPIQSEKIRVKPTRTC